MPRADRRRPGRPAARPRAGRSGEDKQAEKPFPKGEEARINYANSDGIVEYVPDEDRGLYIRALTGGWYHARTMGKCPRLAPAVAIGFETNSLGQLDRTGALRVQGWRCPLASLVKSPPPPGRKK